MFELNKDGDFADFSAFADFFFIFGSQCRTLDGHISITGDCMKSDLSRVEVE